MNIVCVVPTIRPESHAQFVKAWRPLFEKHGVTLVTVWDGDEPDVSINEYGKVAVGIRHPICDLLGVGYKTGYYEQDDPSLFCRRTDACRNLGFVAAARLGATHVLTLDDDVAPLTYDPDERVADPVQAHLDALDRRYPLSWTNTAHDTDLYLRGVPYGVRTEAPAMLSHGVWVGTPDFDGETQLRLENYQDPYMAPTPVKRPNNGLPYSLPYYVGPVPRGALFPLCGMNVMVRREALPYLYFAPMGADSGAPDLHRFADIFMGVFLKREFDRLGWACVTGYSTVLHTRASDAAKNFEQEKLGREWMERVGVWSRIDNEVWKLTAAQNPSDVDEREWSYFRSYADKRARYADLINSLSEESRG